MTGGFLLIFTQLRQPGGLPFNTIADFRGLCKTENLVCWSLSVFLFSMAGIPPLAGFFGKYYLISATVEKGLFVAAIVALAVSLVTAYYYLRIIKTFWFEEDIAVREPELLLNSEQRALLSIMEASLWGMAFFAPGLLPVLDIAVVSLTLCGDVAFNIASSPTEYNNILSLGGFTYFCKHTRCWCPLWFFTPNAG
jgi:NADH:ubiquinone oxidoreductase subunit 2 (subunit N)